jgi:hypothetical protein
VFSYPIVQIRLRIAPSRFSLQLAIKSRTILLGTSTMVDVLLDHDLVLQYCNASD